MKLKRHSLTPIRARALLALLQLPAGSSITIPKRRAQSLRTTPKPKDDHRE